MLSVNTNMMSLNAQASLSKSQSSLADSMAKLSSGMRVNSAKDDAAGLAIATGMTSQIRGMTVAQRNANDGVSLSQVAEGSIGTMQDTLQRMRDLAVQSANGLNTGSDRNKLQKEFSQLSSELTRTIQNTSFNGKKILNGSAANIVFQVGANTSANNQITIQISNLALVSGVVSVASNGGVSIGSNAGSTGARAAIDAIDRALSKLSDTRATLGAAQNRLTSAVSTLGSQIENQTAARSRIMDTDFASETANLSRSQILQQAGTAMLTQANQAPQTVLSLLR